MSSKWKTLTGIPVEHIVQWVKDETRDGQIIHIGTDSLQTGRWTQFVTVVVILNRPKGGRVAYYREIVPRISSLRERLNKEVWKSIDLAMQMPETPELTVHIDANPDERFMSSKYLQELVGLVVGQGFKALWKPDSWAATHAADHIVRVKGKLPYERTGRIPRKVRKSA
jgi:predicted RNase H-related nuclease YkuK (DUF458 family)